MFSPRWSGSALFVIAALVLFAPAGFVAQERKPASDSKSGTTVVKGDVGRLLDDYLRSKERFPDGFSGVALVAKEGEVLLEQAYGIADAHHDPVAMRTDAIFDWASVTKQFTAAAVLKLEMQKKLSIDDPIKKHFPDAPKDKAGILVRHLLDHTSGIPHDADLSKANLFDRDLFVKTVLALPVVSAPGAKWEYNNVAYFLLAALIEKVSGKSWESYLRENLFEPAGMKDAGCIGDGKFDLKRVPYEERGTLDQFAYGPRLSWGYRGAGGVLACVEDMLRWDVALRGDKILSKAAKLKYYEPHLENYALGWQIRKPGGGTRVQHGGAVGKLRTYFLRDLDKPLVVLLAANWIPPQHPEIYATELAEIARTGRAK